jgi:hypothetical protein
MKFSETRTVERIQIPITRVCHRRCPNCIVREQLAWYDPRIEWRELPLDELRRIGSLIGPIKTLEITGGEPTMHSQFAEISNRLADIFQCDDVMLVTNGWLFKEHPEALPLLMKYHRVYLSHYTDEFVMRYGTRTNTEACVAVGKYMAEQGHIGLRWNEISYHFPYAAPPYPGTPCWWYESDMVSCFNSTLYGCCIAWGLKNPGKGIPLTADWRAHLAEIELPCETCPNSGRG